MRGLIEIKSLNFPDRVETRESVVMDCVYTMDEEEDKKLVVKWFFNDDPVPIYQWIPELNVRTPSPRIADKINMDYSINSSSSPISTSANLHRYIKYRAINIIKPTIDLSGRYSCYVASLRSQDYKEKDMIVYERATSDSHTSGGTNSSSTSHLNIFSPFITLPMFLLFSIFRHELHSSFLHP